MTLVLLENQKFGGRRASRVDNYAIELAEIVARLRRGNTVASVRGDGMAGFVFAEHGPRAAEISRAELGWWVEFWDGDAVAADWSFPAAGEAVQAVAMWLATDAEQGAADVTSIC
jgi:hypothetical protein